MWDWGVTHLKKQPENPELKNPGEWLGDASRSEDSCYWQRHFRIIAYSTCEGAWRRKDCCNLVNKRVNVKDIITHRLPLADAGKGFKLVAEAKESIKVIIEPQR